ncbi:hypothetical protein [Planctobacterium marinum]|uniref:hypothetical protein n=1 Tax=Planctobacterium marinum TaxID=1631968 RepID=UPI001E5D7934|nr:hypothetical protein [Planctobacterium marinum]MCC2605863.1 hypothetical protein [Planctobacterium marinum]
MSRLESVIKELLHIKQELSLRINMLEMEAQQQWQTLLRKLSVLEDELEHDLVTLAEKLGHYEEERFVGNEQEIENLLNEFRALHSKSRH